MTDQTKNPHKSDDNKFRLVPNEKGHLDLHIEIESYDSLFTHIYQKNVLNKSTLTSNFDSEFGTELFKPLLGHSPDTGEKAFQLLSGLKGNNLIDKVRFNKNGETVATLPFDKLQSAYLNNYEHSKTKPEL